MAAFSKPSLRSSFRQSASLDNVPPTEQNCGKFTRESSRSIDNHTAKRQKLYRQDFSHAKAITRTRFNKDFLAPARRIAKNPARKLATTEISGAPVPQVPNVLTSSKHPTAKNKVTTNDNARATKKPDKRILRSQDGGLRSKSELALYFANYDELVSIEAKNPDFFTTETRVQIIDDNPRTTKSKTVSTPVQTASKHLRPASPSHSNINGVLPASSPLDSDFRTLNDAQRIDFSSIARHARHNDEDLLTDAVYFKAHRRAERQEKQLRNIEKERAQHEKVQLERLFEGLKGHDWLRVMGISGITESEKKAFEPKRDFLIHEVASLIDKFKMWKEEEKRRKVEKEQNLLTEGDDEGRSQTGVSVTSGGEPPNYNDIDAWAARQLHQEATSATDLHSEKDRKNLAQAAPAPPRCSEKPFVSFYAKPYLRDATIGKHRRGRTRFAFGQPLPDVAEKPFSLPPDMLSQDVLAASARNRRRARREGKDQ